MHTDAAQSPGKIPVDVSSLGVDLLSIAGHKLYAPKGIGALYVRKGLAPETFCHGAGQEMGRRAGTENVAGIVGLGKACEMATANLAKDSLRMRALRDRLHEGIAGRTDGVRLNGHPEHCLPNTLNLSFQGLDADRLLEEIGKKWPHRPAPPVTPVRLPFPMSLKPCGFRLNGRGRLAVFPGAHDHPRGY